MRRFVDVSNNNGPDVDFAKLKAEGASGVYLKVTEGTSFVDPDYDANYKRAKAAGLKVGGYHFGHPGNNSVEELKFFLSHLHFEKGVDLYPALDLEVNDGAIAVRVHLYGASFIAGLRLHFGKAVLYSGQSFMESYGLVALKALKWVADYGARPYLHWDAWQYTDGQPQFGSPIGGIDTSFALDFSSFVSGSHFSPIKKHVKRVWIVLDGMRVQVGSKAWRFLKRAGKRLRG